MHNFSARWKIPTKINGPNDWFHIPHPYLLLKFYMPYITLYNKRWIIDRNTDEIYDPRALYMFFILRGRILKGL
jgi:hypothetical protein